jgi:hypothetical protein
MVQSNDIDRTPRPSLAIEPPKRLVTNKLCWFVRQKTETPASNGTTTWVNQESDVATLKLTDVLREGLPDEKYSKSNVEDPHTLFGHMSIPVKILQ